jgi:hypothetical protein
LGFREIHHSLILNDNLYRRVPVISHFLMYRGEFGIYCGTGFETLLKTKEFVRFLGKKNLIKTLQIPWLLFREFLKQKTLKTRKQKPYKFPRFIAKFQIKIQLIPRTPQQFKNDLKKTII